MKKLPFSVLFAVLMLIALPVRAELFGLKGYVLENGMRVVVVSNHKAPIAKHMVWYKVGAADEKLGKGGSAHLLEHLMFRGTRKVRGQSFNRILEENGADSNAFTAQDVTAYHEFVDISRLELVMALEADRMRNLSIDDESFETERKIVYQERKQVVENNPLYKFNEELQRLFWQNHPYSRPITGSENEILSLTDKDVKDIYRHYYVPNNAVLVIAGDIEPETAFRLAEKYYGDIKPAKVPENRLKFDTEVKTKTTLRMKLPNIELPRLVKKYHVPGYAEAKGGIYAYMVLSKYLGEGEVSKLYVDLVVNRKMATGVSTDYNFTAPSGGSFSISAIPAKGVSVDEMTAALDDSVKQAMSELNDRTLQKYKKQMLSGLVYAKDNPNEAAQIVGMLATAGMSDDEIENYADNIEKVTVADVKKAYMQMLQSPQTEAVVEPEGAKK